MQIFFDKFLFPWLPLYENALTHQLCSMLCKTNALMWRLAGGHFELLAYSKDLENNFCTEGLFGTNALKKKDGKIHI